MTVKREYAIDPVDIVIASDKVPSFPTSEAYLVATAELVTADGTSTLLATSKIKQIDDGKRTVKLKVKYSNAPEIEVSLVALRIALQDMEREYY